MGKIEEMFKRFVGSPAVQAVVADHELAEAERRERLIAELARLRAVEADASQAGQQKLEAAQQRFDAAKVAYDATSAELRSIRREIAGESTSADQMAGRITHELIGLLPEYVAEAVARLDAELARLRTEPITVDTSPIATPGQRKAAAIEQRRHEDHYRQLLALRSQCGVESLACMPAGSLDEMLDRIEDAIHQNELAAV